MIRTQALFKPRSNLTHTSLKLRSNLAQTLLKPCSNLAQTSLILRSNLAQTLLKPRSNLYLALSVSADMNRGSGPRGAPARGARAPIRIGDLRTRIFEN